jgi:hypothetical protein
MYHRSTREVRRSRLSRVMMYLAVAFVSDLMLTMIAAPAFAFHHAFLPGGACGQSENAGGNNVTATNAIKTHNPHRNRRCRCRRQARRPRTTPSASQILRKRRGAQHVRSRAYFQSTD